MPFACDRCLQSDLVASGRTKCLSMDNLLSGQSPSSPQGVEESPRYCVCQVEKQYLCNSIQWGQMKTLLHGCHKLKALSALLGACRGFICRSFDGVSSTFFYLGISPPLPLKLLQVQTTMCSFFHISWCLGPTGKLLAEFKGMEHKTQSCPT